jgi:hypothetical protein
MDNISACSRGLPEYVYPRPFLHMARLSKTTSVRSGATNSPRHCWPLGVFQSETTKKSLVQQVLMNGFSENTHHFPVKYFLEIYLLPFMVILDHVSDIIP